MILIFVFLEYYTNLSPILENYGPENPYAKENYRLNYHIYKDNSGLNYLKSNGKNRGKGNYELHL